MMEARGEYEAGGKEVGDYRNSGTKVIDLADSNRRLQDNARREMHAKEMEWVTVN